MTAPANPPAAVPPFQGQMTADAAQRWLYELILFDISEQQRINRATIAQSRGLNPLAYAQPLPLLAPPEQMPAPVAQSAAVTQTPAASSVPVDTTPPVNTAAASTTTPPPASLLVDWSVDPKTGKLLTAVRRATST